MANLVKYDHKYIISIIFWHFRKSKNLLTFIYISFFILQLIIEYCYLPEFPSYMLDCVCAQCIGNVPFAASRFLNPNNYVMLHPVTLSIAVYMG